ncbi:MAG TPA: thioredoxin family protein [bacterium]|nr:thioredoxin family protein [bacterium]
MVDMTGHHAVVSKDEWIEARKRLLVKEKEFTRLRDQLSQDRRDLPWERVDKPYSFEGPNGKETLSELFAGRSQLVIYHFMFAPDWKEGCPHCSRWADNFNGVIVHLNQRDVTMVAVSRVSYGTLAAYRKRMSWGFKWVSSAETDFNSDYHVSFTPQELARAAAFYNFTIQDPGVSEREGVSVFFKDATGGVFHTYSAYARGIDMLNVDYHYLDLVPKGRDEGGRGPYWVRRHDEYGR